MKLFQFAHFRLVYKWFYFIYKLSYALGIIGYIIMMLTFVGFNFIFGQPPNVWMDIGFMFIYYGVYFGVLGRDISEIIADKMAANIGVSRIYLLHVSFRKISIFNISKRKISSSLWIFRHFGFFEETISTIVDRVLLSTLNHFFPQLSFTAENWDFS